MSNYFKETVDRNSKLIKIVKELPNNIKAYKKSTKICNRKIQIEMYEKMNEKRAIITWEDVCLDDPI